MFRDFAGEAVILNLANGSTEQVLASLLAEYEVEEGPLRQDIDALLHTLVEKGLIVVNPEQTPAAG